MSEPGQRPEAGWYDDPYQPGRLRYFDGEVWTHHYHRLGELLDVGGWLNATLLSLRLYWRGALAIAGATTLIGNLVLWIAVRRIAGDLAVIDEELVNWSSAKTVLLAGVAVFATVWQGFGWVALNRYLCRAHLNDAPSVLEAVKRGVTRLPQLIGWMMVLGLAGFVVVAFAITGIVIAPPLAIVVVPALLVGLVWAMVKLTFLSTAVAVVPSGVSAVRASASVSHGRFWPVFGRVVLFGAAVFFLGNVVTTLLGDAGSPVDQEAAIALVEVDGDQLLVNDFSFSDLLPGWDRLLVAMVLSTVVGAASTAVITSAFTRLYLDSGAPTDL